MGELPAIPLAVGVLPDEHLQRLRQHKVVIRIRIRKVQPADPLVEPRGLLKCMPAHREAGDVLGDGREGPRLRPDRVATIVRGPRRRVDGEVLALCELLGELAAVVVGPEIGVRHLAWCSDDRERHTGYGPWPTQIRFGGVGDYNS